MKAGDQEVAVAEWTRGATPISCKWVKPPGPPRGFDFDVTKTEQIFDLLLKEKQLKLPESLKIPTVQELNGKPYCKWHNSYSHTTSRVWRQQIQMAIEQGRLIFNQYAMKVDTHPFPAVNMVECTYPGGCQPGFSFNINMVGPGHHSGKDGDEGSCSHRKDTEEAAPRDRSVTMALHHEGEVRNVRYQRPLSDHLLNKYVSQYDQRRRPNDDDERDRLARDARRHRRHDRDEEKYERRAKEKSREQDDEDRHWDCPFFRHCWDSGMSRLPTIGNCPECKQKKKEAANMSVFQRLGPLPPRNKHAESPRVEDLEDLEDDEEEEDSSDLIKTNVTLSDFNGQASDAQGVLNVDLTVGRKTIPTTFFVVDSKSTYAVLLGRDWIHANCCIPSTMHQCVIQWDGDEVEVVQADDSAEISTAGMNAWETAGQEPLSGINLDDCERIDVTKDGVRLVLSTGLTV
ncbi:hypothetical protein QYE76_019290 [Lolium multiflorum]|uniref:Uncharacterized protein n=1 Tax=Lolium multiflorum TaxID=4521 RepID=A0AAD8VR50_LOLMU|nr:hypothetical protein QYE76_019290 [Lolium multiflorum]